ncbi:putative methyltransferase PMT21 [Capsicum annuum]|nr:putative methyltransferase PMT21 [Capsicum annuum]
MDAPVRRCERLALDGFRRGRGRPKKYWGEVIRQDMEQLQLTEDMTLDKKDAEFLLTIRDLEPVPDKKFDEGTIISEVDVTNIVHQHVLNDEYPLYSLRYLGKKGSCQRQSKLDISGDGYTNSTSLLFGGVYLLEVHRILRPGGFWVLSGPPVNYQRGWRGWNTTIEEQKSDYDKLQELLTSMCFKLFNKKDDIAVWQKLSDNSCYKKLDNPDSYPSKCDDGTEPDSAWYTPLRPCVVVPNPAAKKLKLDALPKWPERLHVAPERISDLRGGSAGAFKHDDGKWKARMKHYKKLLPAIGTDKIRNVMDMNTLYGGFAAAVIDDPLWVMNVVSSYAPNTLPVVLSEHFMTGVRLSLHIRGHTISCMSMASSLRKVIEMDRILRPLGYAIIRESSYFVDAIATMAKGTRWSCRKEETEYGVDKEKLLICQKKLWYSKQSS